MEIKRTSCIVDRRFYFPRMIYQLIIPFSQPALSALAVKAGHRIPWVQQVLSDEPG
jgi:hypothetical protein